MAETLGQRLQALRAARKLRLADVAPVAGISISWLNDIEHDRNPPSLDTLVGLAMAFDLTVVELLAGTSPYVAAQNAEYAQSGLACRSWSWRSCVRVRGGGRREGQGRSQLSHLHDRSDCRHYSRHIASRCSPIAY